MSTIRRNPKEECGPAPVGRTLFGPDGLSREGAAAFLIENSALIKRRIIGKLRAANIPWVDPDDVQSSIFRRVDLAVLRGTLRAHCEREFWAFLTAIMEKSVLNRLRTEGHQHAGHVAAAQAEAERRHLTTHFARCRIDGEAVALVHRMVMSLPSEPDRKLLFLRLRGITYRAISVATGRSETALRTQWVKILYAMRDRFAGTDAPRGRVGTKE